MRAFPSSARGRAFTLIEMLIVLGIIGVLAAILISQISNAAYESRRILSRQQQVVLQSAVNSWVIQRTTTQSLAAVQTAYNNATTAKAKVTLVSEYLDSDTYDHFDDNTSDTAKVQSDAMKRIGKWVELPTWAAGSYPRVNLLPVD
jgi:prepilin-type N-terminal cleavage/methylation domain-containing protein